MTIPLIQAEIKSRIFVVHYQPKNWAIFPFFVHPCLSHNQAVSVNNVREYLSQRGRKSFFEE